MFTIIQEFTEKYRGFRGSLFSIHPLSGCERLHPRGRRADICQQAGDENLLGRSTIIDIVHQEGKRLTVAQRE